MSYKLDIVLLFIVVLALANLGNIGAENAEAEPGSEPHDGSQMITGPSTMLLTTIAVSVLAKILWA